MSCASGLLRDTRARHVRESTDRLAADLGASQVRYQGNWIPHELRPSPSGKFFRR